MVALLCSHCRIPRAFQEQDRSAKAAPCHSHHDLQGPPWCCLMRLHAAVAQHQRQGWLVQHRIRKLSSRTSGPAAGSAGACAAAPSGIVHGCAHAQKQQRPRLCRWKGRRSQVAGIGWPLCGRTRAAGAVEVEVDVDGEFDSGLLESSNLQQRSWHCNNVTNLAHRVDTRIPLCYTHEITLQRLSNECPKCDTFFD